MDQIRIPFGTPESICYEENDARTGFSVDVKCRIRGFVTVSECPDGYEDEAALRSAVKELAISSLTEYLHNLRNTDFGRLLCAYKERSALLGKAVEDALSEKGIRGEASDIVYDLLEPTVDEIKELMKPYTPMGNVYGGPAQFPSVASTMLAYAGPSPLPNASAMMVYAGPIPGNPGGGMMSFMLQQQEEKKFCPACGTRVRTGERFCHECGNKLTGQGG
jgi:hypothetical protein